MKKISRKQINSKKVVVITLVCLLFFLIEWYTFTLGKQVGTQQGRFEMLLDATQKLSATCFEQLSGKK